MDIILVSGLHWPKMAVSRRTYDLHPYMITDWAWSRATRIRWYHLDEHMWSARWDRIGSWLYDKNIKNT